jgi:arsenate reductase
MGQSLRPSRKPRVLFVCIGNSCRSQMAEGFARAYGADVMEVLSAGLYPAPIIAPLTKKTMLEKNIDISTHFPKSLDMLPGGPVHIVINMSGHSMPVPAGATLEEWQVQDPIGLSEDVFRAVARDIEHRVMNLVLALRGKSTTALR